MIPLVKKIPTNHGTATQTGSLQIEILIVVAAIAVGFLIWWPLSKADNLAAGEMRAASLLQSIDEKLATATDLRTLVAETPSADAASFVFHTENLGERDGYLFRLDAAANGPRIYAWPSEYGKTGNAAFLLDPPRPILETRNHRRHYSGKTRQPAEKAGLPANTDPSTAAFGKDSQEWKPFMPRGS